ncbi:MAG: hypothetical protein Unbinned5081contig1001_35 [Prokaryotic dsDNA virus sp.]|nr:MAG: hypothetical protein Unbinned5081contig1001_35 [Prokaryotic dsDNA virus sp.]|tara:strand:- start:21715 stop:21957 length:243 start_codon:yes stop_codon:yes gene_type:complete
MSNRTSPAGAGVTKPFTAHGAFKPAPAFSDLHRRVERDVRKQTLQSFSFILLCVFIGFTAGMVATTLFTEINKARIEAEQ